MKVIVSHDVDHLTVWEHYKDLILPKYYVRNTLEMMAGVVSFKEYCRRYADLLTNKWQNLDELMTFDASHGVVSTFFIAVAKGYGLSYSLDAAAPWIQKILSRGFRTGVHGIAFSSFEEICRERELFRQISGLESFGIRMHYLHFSNPTLSYLRQAGYLFDSTVMKMENPYFEEGFPEFPLHLMDGVVCADRKRKLSNRTLEEAKSLTKKIIEEAEQNHIAYFTVLFHDRYFSNRFIVWRSWYTWLIQYLCEKKVQFVTYEDALAEIRKIKRSP